MGSNIFVVSVLATCGAADITTHVACAGAPNSVLHDKMYINERAEWTAKTIVE